MLSRVRNFSGISVGQAAGNKSQTANTLRSSVFRDVNQRKSVVFLATFREKIGQIFQGQAAQEDGVILEDGNDWLSRNVGKQLQRYRSADKSLARPTSRCILFDGENISFDASLVIYIKSTNIRPIMIINRIYET